MPISPHLSSPDSPDDGTTPQSPGPGRPRARWIPIRPLPGITATWLTRSPYWLAAGTFGMALLSLFAMFGYLELASPGVEKQVRSALHATARDRAFSLESWIAERRSDAATLSLDEELAERVDALMGNDPDVVRRALVTARLSRLWQAYGYRSVQIIGADGKPVLSVGNPTVAESSQKLYIAPSLYLRQADRLTMCWETKLAKLGHPSRAAGARLEGCAYLEGLPFAAGGAAPNTGTRTLLRREGQVLLLAEPPDPYWHSPALLAGVGAVPLLTETVPLPGTGLWLETAIPRSAALAPLRRMVLGMGLVGISALLGVAVAALTVARRQRLRCAEHEREQAEQSATCFRQFFELPFLGMGMLGAETLKWWRVNPQLCALLGYAEDEMLGASWANFVKEPESSAGLGKLIENCGDLCSIKAVLLRKNGTTLPAALDIKWVSPPGLPASLMVVVQDLTERRLSEARTARLTKLQEAVSHTSRAVAHSSTSETLFPRVCEDAVIYGGMSMAWIGLVDEPSKEVRVAACFGGCTEYLLDAEFSTDPDSPLSRGPTGTAILSGEPAWCQDFYGTDVTAPWQRRAKECGWQASAALPLRQNGRVVGALSIYASEKGVFTPAVQRLLGELVADLGFALDNFAREKARELAAEALRESEMFNAEVIDSLPEQIVVVDDHGRIVTANRTWRNFLRAAGRHDLASRFKGTEYLDGAALIPRPADEAETWELLAGIRDVLAGRAAALDTRYRCESGQEERWFRVRATPLSGKAGGAVISHENITRHKAALAHIQHLAHFDSLTGLPNRAMLADRATQDIRRAQRREETLALIFIDLDRFKVINDSLGHKVGDGVLQQIANRLADTVRSEDTVSRLGGDEFILVLPNTSADGAAHVAQGLLEVLSAPCHVGPHELVVSASMGIAMYPADGLTYDDLSRSADVAMYRAKRKGRSVFQFFTAEMQARSVRALQVETALRKAVEQSQLRLHYQPQLDLKAGVIVGAEALLRWTHPELGEVSPAEFIPIAEDSGLILPIGEWVLQEAARQLRVWQDSELQDITVAVNLSAVQFRQASLPARVSKILADAGVPAGRLEFELTEGTTMEDPDAAVAMMGKLRDSGISLAIDDFGVGYSSLSHLKRFRLSKLKIDQSFVRGVTVDGDDRAIVRALLTLSRSLGLNTLAEGVASREQFAFLRAHGCDAVQGYFIGEPLEPAKFEALVREVAANGIDALA